MNGSMKALTHLLLFENPFIVPLSTRVNPSVVVRPSESSITDCSPCTRLAEAVSHSKAPIISPQLSKPCLP